MVVAQGEMIEIANSDLEKAYHGTNLAFDCWSTMHGNRETTLDPQFMGDWCDLKPEIYEIFIKLFLRVGLLEICGYTDDADKYPITPLRDGVQHMFPIFKQVPIPNNTSATTTT
jgi:hypothetical protein